MRTTLPCMLALYLASCAHQPGDPQHGHAKGHKHGKHHAHGHKSKSKHHRFANPERWARVFDKKSRAKWQKPQEVIAKLALRPNDHVADIGAGTGYFSLPLARAVPQGLVYALDIEHKMAAYAEARAKKAGLKNVKGSVAGEDDARIPGSVDVVFLCNTYHHIAGRTAYFSRVAKSLKAGGRVVVVDFKPGELPVGPPPDHRVLPADLHEELVAAGYTKLELDNTTLPYQYIAIYQR